MSSPAHVYKGFWVDYSFDKTQGATLTLPARDGTFLVAFVTMFVTVAASQAWVLICFAVHQLRTTRERRDALFHQQQVLFRNGSSALALAWDFWRLLLGWRKAARRPFARNLPWICVALLYFTAFTAAGIFSSQVTLAASSRVLLNSPYCGFYNISVLTGGINGSMVNVDYNRTAARNALYQRLALSSLSYAKSCYGDSVSPQCKTYRLRSLPWTSKSNVSCPYDANICGDGGKSVYEMDTGFLSAQNDLGLNAPDADQLYYRRKTTCARLNASNYATIWNPSGNSSYAGSQFVNVTMGPTPGSDNTLLWNTQTSKVGVGYQLFTARYFPDLDLGNITYDDGTQLTQWMPVNELRGEADLSLIIVPANAITYAAPTDDPIFSAHKSFTFGFGGSVYTLYRPDHYLPTMACNDAYQFCNGEKCTPMTGLYKLDTAMHKIGLSDLQLANAALINNIHTYSTMYDIVTNAGVGALLANGLQNNQLSPGLPNNQWKLELGNWFNISLAQLQLSLYLFGDGLSHNITEIARPAGKVGDIQCRSLMIQNTSNHLNFSVLGLILIFVFGGILIILGLSIEWIASCVHRIRNKRGSPSHRELAWSTDHKLQLQRLAYEGAGWDGWTNGAEYVPVPVGGDLAKLGVLVIEDPNHPVIERKLHVGTTYESTGYAASGLSADYGGPGPSSAGGSFYKNSMYGDVVSPSGKGSYKDEYLLQETPFHTNLPYR